MTELKCPYCQQELVYWGIDTWYCANCAQTKFSRGNRKLWQDLIDTKKKLDRAIWWLNEIVENHRFTPISTAEKALAELTKGRKDE